MEEDHASDVGAWPASEVEDDTAGKAAAVVRVRCVKSELIRSIIGYGDTSEEAYGNAIAEAREFCRELGGIRKLTKL